MSENGLNRDATGVITNGHGHPGGYPDRTPPMNLEAEKGVLGSILLDAATFGEVDAILSPEDFYRDAHATIYRQARALMATAGALDVLMLAEELRRDGPMVGVEEALGQLLGCVPHGANAAYYAHIVRSKALLRRMIEACEETLRDCYRQADTVEAIVAAAEARVLAVGESASGAGDVSPASAAVDEALTRIAARESGEVSGVPTGYRDLDDRMGGCLGNGELTILAARPSMGKAQPLDARVLTPAGFVPMGSLAVGDAVIGSDGKPCRVTGVFPRGELPVFRVTMTDGGETECCDEHLWFTQTRNERRRGVVGSVKPLHEIRRTIARADNAESPNHAIPVMGAAQYAAREQPALDPYAMGLLLGDGCFRGGCVTFSNPEDDLVRRLADRLPAGDRLTPIGGGRPDHRIARAARNNEVSFTRAALIRYGLDGLGSRAKFVPADYLYGHEDCRRDTLLGLCDTDGYVIDSGMAVEYSTSSMRLAMDVASLARSVGGVARTVIRVPHYTHKGEHLAGAVSARMLLSFPDGRRPVSSDKHVARWSAEPKGRYHRSIRSIELAGYKPCRCITVDAPDHLYVTDDFIVTHNSAIALGICEHAGDLDTPALLISLEMGKGELGERMLAGRSRVAGDLLKRPWRMNAADRSAIGHAAGILRPRRLWIDDAPARSMAQIAAIARRHKARHGLGLLVVDYLQLIDGTGEDERGRSRQEVVAKISRRLKMLAKQLGVPVVALSQLNRECEGRADRRPSMSDLRESGAIEQDADNVLLVHRPDYYDPNDKPGLAEVIVAKQRNGAAGVVVELAFLKTLARFEDVSHAETRF